MSLSVLLAAYGGRHAADGAVCPSSPGYNPTLTICAVVLRAAHGIVGTRPG